ncbi:cytochrome bc complex cytochrome b subunit [bacterium]|nr:cytochrome bc complex cytochrome b subunit [bacterium]
MSKSIKQRAFVWLDERFDLQPLLKMMDHKRVPIHSHTIWYYMGGVTLFLFLVQVFTGILLLMYYRPGEDSAYESMKFLLTEVKFGWLFRNVHAWSANLMVLFAFIHMFSVIFTKAFVKPRELTWISGFILLLLAMFFGFSGYLLPWNELSFFATKVGTDIMSAIPFIGDAIKTLLRGGEEVTGATLSRFFGFHVAILPLITTLVLGFHLLLIQRQGISETSEFKLLPPEKKRYMSFFPDFILRDGLLWLIINIIVLYLAVFFPWELGLKADSLAPAPMGIKPEWYFMFMFETLKMIPPHVWFIEGETFGILLFGVAALLWLAVPFARIGRKPLVESKWITILGLVTLSYMVVFTIIGYL